MLLALLRLRDEAYGVSVRNLIAQRTERDVAVGAVYTTLERLELKLYISSRIGDTSRQRGGRRKKYYRLEPPGERALSGSFEALKRMVHGLGKELEWL